MCITTLLSSSTRRVHPWSFASLQALDTGAGSEQALRKWVLLFLLWLYQSAPSLFPGGSEGCGSGAPLRGGGRLQPGRAPPARWAVAPPYVLFPLHALTPCCHELLLAGLWNLRPLDENSSQASGTVIAELPSHIPVQGACPVLVLCVHCAAGLSPDPLTGLTSPVHEHHTLPSCWPLMRPHCSPSSPRSLLPGDGGLGSAPQLLRPQIPVLGLPWAPTPGWLLVLGR